LLNKVDTLKRLRKVQKSGKSKCTPLTSFYKFCKSLDDSECTFEAIEEEKENSDDGNSDSDSDEEDDNNSESEVQEVISDNEEEQVVESDEEQVVESDEEDNDKESEENSNSYKRSTRSGKSVATPLLANTRMKGVKKV